MALNEEFKLLKLNTVLNKFQNEMKKNKLSDPIAQNITSSLIQKKKYHIRVVLKELVHNPRIKLENMPLHANEPPQKLFLMNLLSNNRKSKKNDNSLFSHGDLICPCLNKRLWLHKDNLIAYRILKINIQLDSLEMTDILKHCPNPKICLDPNEYIIKNNPQQFIKIINDLRRENDIFNYVFNFWQHIPMYALNNDAIYKLDEDLHQIDEACIQDDNNNGNDEEDDNVIKYRQYLKIKTDQIVKKYKNIKRKRIANLNNRKKKKIRSGIFGGRR